MIFKFRWLLIGYFILLCPVIQAFSQEIGHDIKIGPQIRGMIETGESSDKDSQPRGFSEEMTDQQSIGPDDRIRVIIILDADPLKPVAETGLRELSLRVAELGGTLGDHAYNNVQATLPLKNIETLAGWSGIKGIKLPFRPDINAVITEGLGTIGAAAWQDSGVSGKGVKTGVIDVGFAGYDTLIGSELPNLITTKVSGLSSDFTYSYHGTACAEILHDIAPDSHMHLVNVADVEVDFTNAVDWMNQQGVSVISSSIGISLRIQLKFIHDLLNSQSSFLTEYYKAQMKMLDDILAQWDNTVKRADGDGITWVQAAGNDGRKKWLGKFIDTDNDRFLNFSTQENANEIEVENAPFGDSLYVVMSWGDPDVPATEDYDLYVRDEAGNLLCSSALDQANFQVGVESCRITVNPFLKYFVSVDGARPGKEEISIMLGTEDFPNFKHHNGEGTVKLISPAYTESALTVGAVSAINPDRIRDYSSRGPNDDGVIKPDLVAPDGVSTVTYGSRGFFGTSAATPHVAGAAALVKGVYPGWNPSQIRSYLELSAIDLGESGEDNVFGSGRVKLPLNFGADFSGAVPLSGNWDGFSGDGIGLFAGGRFYLDRDNDGYIDEVVTYGKATDLPIVGDWDGDGIADIGVYRRADRTFYLDIDRDEITDRRIVYGAAGDIPLSGDWNGDGISDISVYRPSRLSFYLDFNQDGRSEVIIVYGTSGDVPVVGDWDGDRKADIGMYRSSRSTFFLDFDENGRSEIRTAYGTSGDIPFSGDWDGDDIDGTGVFRTSNRTFYLDRFSDGITDYRIAVR